MDDGGQTEEESCLMGVAGEGDEKIKCGGERKSGWSCRDFPEFSFNRVLGIPHWAVKRAGCESCTLSD